MIPIQVDFKKWFSFCIYLQSKTQLLRCRACVVPPNPNPASCLPLKQQTNAWSETNNVSRSFTHFSLSAENPHQNPCQLTISAQAQPTTKQTASATFHPFIYQSANRDFQISGSQFTGHLPHLNLTPTSNSTSDHQTSRYKYRQPPPNKPKLFLPNTTFPNFSTPTPLSTSTLSSLNLPLIHNHLTTSPHLLLTHLPPPPNNQPCSAAP